MLFYWDYVQKAPGNISPCPSDCSQGWPPAPYSPAHPAKGPTELTHHQAHLPDWPWPVVFPRDVSDVQWRGCPGAPCLPWSWMRSVTGPSCQVLSSRQPEESLPFLAPHPHGAEAHVAAWQYLVKETWLPCGSTWYYTINEKDLKKKSLRIKEMECHTREISFIIMTVNFFDVLENRSAECFSQISWFKLIFVVKSYSEGEQRATSIQQHRSLVLRL